VLRSVRLGYTPNTMTHVSSGDQMKRTNLLLAALTTSLIAMPLHAQAGWNGHGKGNKSYKASKTAKSHAYKSDKAARWEAYKAAKTERWNKWIESMRAHKASKSTKTYATKSYKHTKSYTKSWDKSWKSDRWHRKSGKASKH
jgi:uncharacterized protein YaiL (DUF2058 family)